MLQRLKTSAQMEPNFPYQIPYVDSASDGHHDEMVLDFSHDLDEISGYHNLDGSQQDQFLQGNPHDQLHCPRTIVDLGVPSIEENKWEGWISTSIDQDLLFSPSTKDHQAGLAFLRTMTDDEAMISPKTTAARQLPGPITTSKVIESNFADKIATSVVACTRPVHDTDCGGSILSCPPQFPDDPRTRDPSPMSGFEERVGNVSEPFDANAQDHMEDNNRALSPWQSWDNPDPFCPIPLEHNRAGWPNLEPNVTTLATPYFDHFLDSSFAQTSLQTAATKARRKAKFIPPRKWSPSRLRGLAYRDRPKNLPESVNWDIRANGADIQDIPISQLMAQETITSGSYTVVKEIDDTSRQDAQKHAAEVSVGSRVLSGDSQETVVPFRAMVTNELDEVVFDLSWRWNGKECQLLRSNDSDNA